MMDDIIDVDPTLPVVKNMLLLDNEGRRIAVNYYSSEWSTVAQQANFEKAVYAKTSRTNARGEAEIITFDNVIVVYKFVGDLMFYVTGSADENEIILYSVLNGFVDGISLLLRNAVEKKTVLENLDLVLLTMDEAVDGGLILETDGATIASRVAMRTADEGGPVAVEAALNNPNIQTLSQAFGSVRDQLTRSFLR